MQPTIVLVHGAFAEPASWNGVIDALTATGHPAERFHTQFCADVRATDAALMAATQRPVLREALVEPSGERASWKERPSWFVVAELDRNIPAVVQRFMAERAGAQRAIELEGASHAAAVSQPHAVAELIFEAARVAAVA